MATRIILGDCREQLLYLPSDSVQCVVTSPPYYGLRSYLPEGHADKRDEIGCEPTLQQWVDTMVQVFREVRRVLRPDGTLFLNLGDAYAGSWGAQSREHAGKHAPNVSAISANRVKAAQRREAGTGSLTGTPGLKAKDMMGQPWRVAFALQDDGWWLRQEIIWHKPNPMPESIRDRCTKSHEHIFLLTKSERYFWDFEAVQEEVTGTANARRAIVPAGWATGDTPHTAAAHQVATAHRKVAPTPKAALATSGNDGAYKDGASSRMGRGAGWRAKNNESMDAALADVVDTRNPRSVWTIPTHGFTGAHFATFPPALAEKCITAGTRPGDVVLDPFGGAGTVGLVCDRMQRDCILIELDQRSVDMARARIKDDAPLLADVDT